MTISRALLLTTILATASFASDFHVGPGQTYTALGQVPWYTLAAGDTVYIHYQAAPYHEKILISSRGSASQWIRVLGVPGPNGELPIISGAGATTSTNMHYKQVTPTGSSAIQWNGIVQIAYRIDDGAPKPGYIEVAGLQVQDASSAYSFTGENGVSGNYDDFAACIYARSTDHVIVRNNVLTNCGLGFYNWVGSSAAEIETDTVVSGNYFYNNGIPNSYFEHQIYTESLGVTIEYNRFGPIKAGAQGSQIKDRSAGTVIRYNYIEACDAWFMDLVEADNGAPTINNDPRYMQTWVYGNVLANLTPMNGIGVHWNADLHRGIGRADVGGRLFFYDNTYVTTRDAGTLYKFPLFSAADGGFDCVTSTPGVIDVRNNLFANLPKTAGSGTDEMYFGVCGYENFDFGKNWVSPGYTLSYSGFGPYTGTATGMPNLFSPAVNDPGFVSLAGADFHLSAASSAVGLGGALASAATSNSTGLDLTPTQQYANPQHTIPRLSSGPGSDAGAFQRPASCTPALVSAMNALPALETASPFPISWQLVSSSAPIQQYTIMVSDNGGPFSPLLSTSSTSTPFTGLAGHTYGFFSLAQDTSSGTECAKNGAETTTMLVPGPSCAVNATAQFSIVRGAYRLNPATNRFSQTVTVTNTTGSALSGPFALALDGLSPAISVYNPAGTTSCALPAGSPYVTLNPGTTWAAGQALTILVEYVNPTKAGIIYTPRILQGGSGR
jgi:hypothetical protein